MNWTSKTIVGLDERGWINSRIIEASRLFVVSPNEVETMSVITGM